MLVFMGVNCSKTKEVMHCLWTFACGVKTVVDILPNQKHIFIKYIWNLTKNENTYIKSPNPCSISWHCSVSGDPSFIASLTSHNWVEQSCVESKIFMTPLWSSFFLEETCSALDIRSHRNWASVWMDPKIISKIPDLRRYCWWKKTCTT